MSVSEGIKKYSSKNYYVILTNLDSKDDKNQSKTKIQPWTRVHEVKSKVSKKYGVHNKNIRLFYCNTEMIDDLSMLDYKVIDARSNNYILI